MNANITVRTRRRRSCMFRSRFPPVWYRLPETKLVLVRLIDRFDRREFGGEDTDAWVDAEIVLRNIQDRDDFHDLIAAIIAGDTNATISAGTLRAIALALRWTVGAEVRKHWQKLRSNPLLMKQFARLLRS